MPRLKHITWTLLMVGALSFQFGLLQAQDCAPGFPAEVGVCPGADWPLYGADWQVDTAAWLGIAWTAPNGANSDSLAAEGPFELDALGWWTYALYGAAGDTCVDSLEVVALTQPDAFFTADDGVCGNEGVAFSNQTTGGTGTAYSWDFGDDSPSSSASNPTHFYLLDGGGTTFVTVTLTATNGDGSCPDVHSETIQLLQIPAPDLTIAPLCQSDVNWPNYEMILPPLPFVTSWHVDWGNGEDTTFASPNFVNPPATSYDDFGYFDITLTLEGANGCTNTWVEEVFVGSNPTIGTANPGNTVGLCSPADLVFPITEFTNNVPGTTYTVEFGDGISASYSHPPPASVAHTYYDDSCGETTPEGTPNSLRFKVTAENECGTSISTIDPIRLHGTPDAHLSGPDEVCVGVYDYYAQGTGLIVTEDDCVESDMYWSVTTLEGTGTAFASPGLGSWSEVVYNSPGLYEVTIYDYHAYCEDSQDTVQVCVIPAPAAGATLSATSGCAPLDVDFNASMQQPAFCGSYIHEWTVSGGNYAFTNGTSASSASPSIVFYDEADYTVTQTVSAVGVNCAPAEATYVIEAYSPASIDITPGGIACEGETWVVEVEDWDAGGDGNASFEWYIEGEQVLAPIDVSQILSLNTPGTWVVYGFLTNACGTASDQSAMIVNAAPDLVVSQPSSACAGSDQLVEVTGADNYSWSGAPVSIDPGNEAAVYAPSDDLVITITGTNDYGLITCDAETTVNLVVDPLPEVELMVADAVCEGGEIVPVADVSNGTPGYVLDWVYGEEVFTGPNPVFTAEPGAATVALTVTDAQGCTDAATATVGVNALPVVEAGTLGGFCDQAIDTLLSSGMPAGGEWSGTGIAPSGLLNPADLGIGSWQVTYSFTDANGCTNSDDLTIEVYAPLFADAGPNLAFCDEDTTVQFTGFSPPSQGLWQGPADILDAAAGVVDLGNLPPGNHTFTYTYGTGTCATSDTRQVTIHSNPAFSLIADDLTVCDGDEAVVTAVAFGGSGSGYDITLVGDGWTLVGDDQATIEVALGETPELTGVVEDSNGCVSEEDLSIIVLPLPDVFVTDTLEACDQPIVEFLPPAEPPGGVWSGAGVLDPSGLFDPSIPGAGEAPVVYAYTDAQGCTNTVSTIADIAEPVQAVAGPGASVCDVDTVVQLAGFTPAGGTWSGLALSSEGAWDAGLLAPGDYEATYTYGVGSCATSSSQTLTVLARPTLTLSGPTELCLGDSATYTATADGGAAPFLIEWIAPVASLGETASFLPAVSGPFTVEAFVTDANGCSEWATFTTTVHALPVVDAGPDVTFCNQSIVEQLGGATPQPGTYFGSPAVTASGAFDPSLIGVGVYEVGFAHTDPVTGCTSSDTLVVEVVAPVFADAGPDAVVCLNGGDVVFEPGTGGTWSGVGPVSGFVDAGGVVDPEAVGVGEHAFVLTYGGGSCLTRDTVALEVLALPVLDVAPTSVFCVNDSVVELPEALPLGGAWSGLGLVVGSDPQAFDAMTGVGMYDLAYTYTELATGCTNVAEHVVEVLALPVVDAGADVLLCDQPIVEQLQGASPVAANPAGDWYYGLVGASSAVDEEGVFDPSVSGVGLFDVVYAFTDPATGCVGRDTLEVEVVLPVVAEAGWDTVACANAPELVLDGYSPLTGGWIFGATGGNDAALEGDAGVVMPQGLAPGNYVLVYENGAGTCYTRDSLVLTIDPLPAISMGDDDVFCLNDTLMPLTPPTPSDGTWFGTGVIGTDFNTLVGAGGYDIAYWVEDEVTGCRDTADHHVTVQPLPLVFAGQDLTLCDQPIPHVLTGYAPLDGFGGLGEWSGVGAVADAAVTPEGVFDPSVAGEGTYQIVYTFHSFVSGCTNRDTIDVTVVAPVVAHAGLDTVACANAPLVELEGFAPMAGGLWSGVSAEAQAGLVNNVSGIINPQALAPGSYDFIIEVGSGTCYSADSMTLVVDPLPVISLGGDDAFCLNDTLMPLALAEPEGGTWEGTGVQGTDFNTLVGAGEYDLIYWYESPVTGCRDTLDHEVEVYALPVVEAGPDLVLCDQAIGEQLADFSPGLNAGGTGVFTGLGAGAAAVSPSGWVEPSVAGVGSFEVVYAFTDAVTGCTHTDTLDIVVNEPVIAEAGLDTTVCANAPLLQLAGYSPQLFVNWFSFEQEADAAVVDAAQGVVNPQALTPGAHVFALEYGAGTCYTRDSMQVFVDPLPELSLGNPDGWCGNLTDQTLAPAFPSGGTWFGPNVLDPDAGTYHVQLPPGAYSPGYTYTDPLTGCADTAFHSVTIHPVPVADFAVDTLGCTNAPVAFTQLSTGASQAFWWFGDGVVTIAYEPTHTYASAGFYTVTMRAANNSGCADTLATDLQITIPPTAAATLTPTDGCSPLTVAFDNQSVAPFATFTWQFEGAPASTAFEPAPATFTATDTTAVIPMSLTATNLCATSVFEDTITVQPAPLLSFQLFTDTACTPYALEVLNTSVGLPESLLWDFGNGTTYAGWQPPATLYTTSDDAADFIISLSGENACGSDSIAAPFHLKPNTVAAFFEASTASGCAPLQVDFTDLSQGTTAITFDFGNGFASADSLATTTFTAPGVYEVQQFATNGCAYDTLSAEVEVFAEPDFTLATDQISYCTDDPVQFTIAAATSGTAAWDFGNDEQGAGFFATTTYPEAGTYWAVAQVSTALFACSAEDSVQVVVNAAPVWDLTTPEPGCSPLEAAFLNASTNTNFVTWQFNDGSDPAVVWAPTHTFMNATAAPVNYTVEVHAVSANLCEADTAFTVSVLPEPTAAIVLGSTASCEVPVELEVTNASTGAIASTWWFNGNLVSALNQPTVTATQEGTQALVLEAVNGWGCTDLDTAYFTVYDQPVAALNVFPLTGCQILPVTFENQSVGATTSQLTLTGPSGVLFEGPLDGTATLDLAEAGLHTAAFVATSADGCQVGLDVPQLIQVYPTPTAGFEAAPLIGTAAQIDPLNDTWAFESTSTGATIWNWNFGDGLVGGGETTQHTYSGAGEFLVTLTAANAFGCMAQQEGWVRLDQLLQVFVPNAFTPPSLLNQQAGTGSRGLNDAFRPVFSDLDLVAEYELTIVNRWGEVVFHSFDPAEYWEGEAVANGDHYAPDDTYVWTLYYQPTYEDIGVRQVGHVTLIRD